MTQDIISISGIELLLKIGDSEEEQSVPQRITMMAKLALPRPCETIGADLSQTIDYVAVHQHIKKIAEAKIFCLVEELASEIVTSLLKNFDMAAVSLEVRKYSLPNTEFVSVQVSREK